MKILWITNANEGFMSAAEIPGISQRLIKQGHEIDVFLIGNRTEKIGAYHFIKKPLGKQKLYRIWLSFLTLKFVVQEKPDFIITDWMCAFCTFPVLFMKKIKIVMDIRTIVVSNDISRFKMWNRNIRLAFRYFDGISVITEALKEYLVDRNFKMKNGICVWHSGADHDLFNPCQVDKFDTHKLKESLGIKDKFIVFYHGSIGYKRGVNEVVEAFHLLKDAGQKHIHFVCLGDGAEIDNIKAYIGKHNLKNVTMIKPVPYENVPIYIALADICIVPLPDIEWWRVSSPLKIFEYLAMGKPIIMTDILPNREVVPNDQDALFLSGIQPNTIAEAIVHAHSMPDLLIKMSQKNYEFSRTHCSWDKQAEKLINYLQNL